jgi:protocatechuate 3,4-dioxygenase beta subunit
VRLVITGSVYAADCITPLPNTVLEVCQANAAGEYTDLEGTLMTDADGHYQIDTIMPGMYGAPAHIHMRIYHPSAQAIETELVFAGDPNLPDTTAGFAVIPLARDEAAVDSGSHGVFDIVLTPSDDTGSASPAALGKADLWLQARPGGDSAHSHLPYRHRSDRSSQ